MLKGLDHISTFVGRAVAGLCIILMLLIVWDVVMRYAFRSTYVWVQEMEWHLFALIFLWGAAYTYKENDHVRVDVFYQRWSPRTRAWIDFLGIAFFLIPFCLVIIHSSMLYTLDAWQVLEGSPDPSGLPARYLIKGAVTVGFGLLMLQGFVELIKKYQFLTRHPESPTPHA